MKNGRDVAALSHFSYLPRQLLHALLYLLHPCSRRQSAEWGEDKEKGQLFRAALFNFQTKHIGAGKQLVTIRSA
jgi:hypothetical protein